MWSEEFERLRYSCHGAGRCLDEILDLCEGGLVQAGIGFLETVWSALTAGTRDKLATYQYPLYKHIKLALELLVFFAKLLCIMY